MRTTKGIDKKAFGLGIGILLGSLVAAAADMERMSDVDARAFLQSRGIDAQGWHVEGNRLQFANRTEEVWIRIASSPKRTSRSICRTRERSYTFDLDVGSKAQPRLEAQGLVAISGKGSCHSEPFDHYFPAPESLSDERIAHLSQIFDVVKLSASSSIIDPRIRLNNEDSGLRESVASSSFSKVAEIRQDGCCAHRLAFSGAAKGEPGWLLEIREPKGEGWYAEVSEGMID